MYEIYKEATFEAAHCIEGHLDPVTGEPGKCSQLHGHSYSIGICIRARGLQPIGFVLDYYYVGQILKWICEQLDHKYLNEVLPDMNATAENMARWAYRQTESYLVRHLDPMTRHHIDLQVHYVEVRETAKTFARYYGEEVW